jgi:GPH family glycoside/pentoside/hexuronide:cation symporter
MNDSSSNPSPAQVSTAPPMNFSTKLAFGAGDLGAAITANVLVFFLMIFFTNVAGLPAGIAGSILMIGKISDAINDPIVGVLSDRTKSRWGRRYPWMIFGAIPFGILFFCQWIVPPLGQWELIAYYVAIGVLFNLAYTAINLPYTALTPELTQDYNERTSLNSFRFAFSIGGSIGSLILAQVIFSSVADPQQRYIILGGICAFISVLPIYWCFFGTRHRLAMMTQRQPEMEEAESLPIAEQLKIVWSNRPFLLVIGIYLCSWLGVQVTASILPYFVVNCMQLPEEKFPQVAIMVQGTALLMLFVWSKVSDRYGKKAVYFMGVSLWIIAQGGLFFLQPDQIPLMYFLAVLAGCGVSTAYLIPWSMVPDTIDLDELKTGQRREGIFYAFMVLLQKIGLAVGLFLVGVSLESAGFIERVAGQPLPEQPSSALMAIRVAIGPLPTLVLLAGLVFAYFYPITREIHAGILLQLAERRRQQS